MLKARGSLSSATIAHALATDDGVGPAKLDMSEVTFIEPAGLVAVAALADLAIRRGRGVAFERPAEFNVRNYCSRMRLGALLDSWFVEHGLAAVSEAPHQDELLELRTFSSEFDGEQLASLVHQRVSGVDVDPLVLDALYTAICELAANATSHAQVPHGFAAAQTYAGGYPGTRISFAVADSGIGVRQSLMERYNPADDREALALAVQYGISGTGEAGRGSGLHDVMQAVADLKGRFTIISGNAKLVVTDKGSINPTTIPRAYPGTLIEGQLSCRP